MEGAGDINWGDGVSMEGVGVSDRASLGAGVSESIVGSGVRRFDGVGVTPGAWVGESVCGRGMGRDDKQVSGLRKVEQPVVGCSG